MTSILILALTACVLSAIFGCLEFRTTRIWSDGSSEGLGAGHWAAPVFLVGVATLALLYVGFLAGPTWRAVSCALSAIALGAATFRAGAHWLRLLEERDAPRDYELIIAYGLPIATVAGAIGTVLAILLVLLWLKTAVGADYVR